MDNEMTLKFLAISENEALARLAMTSFITPLDPTIDVLDECKTIVSEAVSNAIIHGYDGMPVGYVTLHAMRKDDCIFVTVQDDGVGISNVEQAREPLYTTKEHLERSGMGFTIMESFSDDFQVESAIGVGTKVTFTKTIRAYCPAAM